MKLIPEDPQWMPLPIAENPTQVSEYTVDSAIEYLKTLDIETVGRWYCDLNTWKCPSNCPEQFTAGLTPVLNSLPSIHPFRVWTKAVIKLLGEKGTSRAWWLYQLGNTEAEWKEWWDQQFAMDPDELAFQKEQAKSAIRYLINGNWEA
jgi:hypothetical protein